MSCRSLLELKLSMTSVNKPTACELLTTILSSSETPAVVVKELATVLLESLSSPHNTAQNKEQLRKLLAQLRQQHTEIFSEVSSSVVNKSNEDGRAEVEQVILSLSVVSVVVVSVKYPFMP